MSEQAFQMGDQVMVNETSQGFIGQQGEVTWLMAHLVYVTIEGEEWPFTPSELTLIERAVSA